MGGDIISTCTGTYLKLHTLSLSSFLNTHTITCQLMPFCPNQSLCFSLKFKQNSLYLTNKQKTLRIGYLLFLFTSRFKFFTHLKTSPFPMQQIMTKIKLDLLIPMTYLYMQFQPYIYFPTKIREWKLRISLRGITLNEITQG
jgi:hypothetical protein